MDSSTSQRNQRNEALVGVLPGSERSAVPGATALGPVDGATEVTLTVLVRRELGAPAAQEDMHVVGSTLTGLGLRLEDSHAPSGRVRVAGSLNALAAAFGTTLDRVRAGTVEHRQRTGPLTVPDTLDGVVTAVLGLDDRPQARPQFRLVESPSLSYTPLQVGAAYAFPVGLDGSGQTIAVLELGGGFDKADLTTYFTGLGVSPPTVTAHSVDGAKNRPDKAPQGADGEVLLDVEVIGALAPGAALAVYFAPNTDQGFVDGVSAALHATPTPVALSISWGQSEDQWTVQGRQALDQAIADGATLGVTVCVAAGDSGSSDGQSGGGNHVDFPASSPHALACGGTSLRAESETVWNDGSSGGATGGGISDTFPQPSWQQGIAATQAGRGVPDVAGNADPDTGYQVRVDGTDTVIGGTSAVAPLWAALIARLAQGLGAPLGLLQPRLYALSSGLTDITSGSNGAYSAGPGWDACTGLGSPQGAALLVALRLSQPAAPAQPAPPVRPAPPATPGAPAS